MKKVLDGVGNYLYPMFKVNFNGLDDRDVGHNERLPLEVASHCAGIAIYKEDVCFLWLWRGIVASFAVISREIVESLWIVDYIPFYFLCFRKVLCHCLLFLYRLMVEVEKGES